MGVDVDIASPSLSVQKLFLLPVCVVTILRFSCRPTLGHVVSGIVESGMVENMGVAAEIASPSISIQKLFLLPVSVVAILRFPCRPTSGHVVSGISESGRVENVGVAAEIASPSLSVQVISTSGFQPAILNSGIRRRRRLRSMLELSKAIIYRHYQMLIHDVPAKNSATWKSSNCEQFSRFYMSVSIPFPVTWYEIKKWNQLGYMEDCIP